jgi:enamine deaminase RidA (YjgF/YER057c/UK114 family)
MCDGIAPQARIRGRLRPLMANFLRILAMKVGTVTSDRRLAALGLTLPPPPTPFVSYAEAVQIGRLLYLSGMLPVVNRQPQYLGRVGAELSVAEGKKAAEIACLSALSAIRAHLGSLDRVAAIAKLGVYIASQSDFREHPQVADGASDLLLNVFGPDRLPTQIVLGVANLPLGMPIEVEILVETSN